ncbi:hypothetical protein [Jeotgalibacillus marinus]|uniref:Uncharacterized protein n=1 Tax=Jeotgalibacillus marinus TaxID=86667 RepID=A0ABV3Q7V5_9BACL
MSVEWKKEECCECKAAAAGAWVAQGFIAFSFALIFIGAVALAVFTSFVTLGVVLAIIATIFFFAIFITSSIVVLKCIFNKDKKCC